MADFKALSLSFDSLTGENKRSTLDPVGYDPQIARLVASTSSLTSRKDQAAQQRKQEALMQRAMAPFKQVGFMCFMMWMSGNSIQIFSIIITISALTGPVMAILKCAEALPQDSELTLDVFTPRLVYCAIFAGQLLFGLYKLNVMGLLPTHASDWISALPAPHFADIAYGAA